MALRKGVCVFSLISIFAVGTAFPQYNGQLQATEPFQISTGTSFTASGESAKFKASRPTTVSARAVASDFEDALDVIKKNYVGGASIDQNELTKSSIDAMLRTLDPHSNYYDANEYSDLLGEHESEYSGTGSSIFSFEKNGLSDTYIVSTFPGSPAVNAGLLFGDRIVAVNGESVSGLGSDIVRDRIRGPRGTSVRLMIERAGSQRLENINLKRERVHQSSVPAGYLLRDGIGYIDLTSGFSNTTSGEMATAMKTLHQQGMTSLVLDLRGNTGGILDQAINIAETFLPAGSKIVSQKGRFADDSRSWVSKNSSPETLPVVLLVDEDTASASEVLAGALQDNDRALIIGERTFGKGLVQNVIGLPYGTGLTLTASRYFTPSGRSIQRDYSDGSLYDYFNHKNAVVDIDKPQYVARTLTNRRVYGGDGIAPDIESKTEKLTARQISILDPLFFFAREYAYGRVKAGVTLPQIRKRVEAGDETVYNETLTLFAAYAAEKSSGKIGSGEIIKDSTFVQNRLRYYLAMAAFGTEAAKRAQILSDPQIAKAIETLPSSAKLAEAARKLRPLRASR